MMQLWLIAIFQHNLFSQKISKSKSYSENTDIQKKAFSLKKYVFFCEENYFL